MELNLHSHIHLHIIHRDNFTFEDTGLIISLFTNFTTNSNNQIEININYNNKSVMPNGLWGLSSTTLCPGRH